MRKLQQDLALQLYFYTANAANYSTWAGLDPPTQSED